jgi:hypothetical protein
MTVRELIENLQGYDPNTEVVFAYPANDYWRTTVCQDVTELDTLDLPYSEYHQKFRLPEDTDRYDNNKKFQHAVVLT